MKKSLLPAIAMLAVTVFIACTTKQVTESGSGAEVRG